MPAIGIIKKEQPHRCSPPEYPLVRGWYDAPIYPEGTVWICDDCRKPWIVVDTLFQTEWKEALGIHSTRKQKRKVRKLVKVYKKYGKSINFPRVYQKTYDSISEFMDAQKEDK
ncbi:hypothetical protein GMA3_43 [Gordonia phage GMA3]|uniref:Uncharacterized protein n=1 Tax=Gordonia phage GMA3 TaxID=1647284 RepID=A0A0K0NKJ3_9CAUD|nr:hypothetical protein AU105_gp043 [Gordonia phage GMA3]AKL88220.1 hypothetical protein GMA3_43 [Gordonia phage GMA3]